MRLRSLAAGLAAGAVGAGLVHRRRREERRDHVELVLDDGSSRSLDAGDPDAAAFFSAARDALAAARG